MKTIGIRDAQDFLTEVADEAQETAVLVTKQGRPSFLILGVEHMDEEDLYWATDEALWEQIAQGRREGPETRTSHEDVKRMFGMK
jgi:prevent-host-death family protein